MPGPSNRNCCTGCAFGTVESDSIETQAHLVRAVVDFPPSYDQLQANVEDGYGDDTMQAALICAKRIVANQCPLFMDRQGGMFGHELRTKLAMVRDE